MRNEQVLWRTLLAALLALALAHLLDPWVWSHLRYPEVIDHDSGRMLRVFGYLPLWLILGVSLAWQGRGSVVGAGGPIPNTQNPIPGGGKGVGDWVLGAGGPIPNPQSPIPGGGRGAPPRWWRSQGMLLAWGPMASGAATETIKILVRRERPQIAEGSYVFHSFSNGLFHGSAFGMPSGHTGVAFGAATILARLAPRAAGVWYLLAAGTAWTRLAQGAHFFSDVVAGAVVGYLVARLLWDRAGHAGTVHG